MGKATKVIIGFKKVLMIPKTKAATRAVKNPSILTDGRRFERANIVSVRAIQRRSVFIP